MCQVGLAAGDKGGANTEKVPALVEPSSLMGAGGEVGP